MHILFYSNCGDRGFNAFERQLATLTPRGMIETFRELWHLEDGLMRPHLSETMLVALFTESSAFEEFGALERLLQELSLILILPDQAPGTVAKAHQLKPRFVTSIESDFDLEVMAVAQKIILKHQKSEEALLALVNQASRSRSTHTSKDLGTENVS